MQQQSFALASTDRGPTIYKCEAVYLGCEHTESPTGNSVCSAATAKLIKQQKKDKKDKNVIEAVLSVTEKGIYVDRKLDKTSTALMKKVEIAELTFIALDKKNKKLMSFICRDERFDRNECHAFHVTKGVPKDFPAACQKLHQNITAESSRAEAEAALIAATTPIMPAGEYANVGAEGLCEDGEYGAVEDLGIAGYGGAGGGGGGGFGDGYGHSTYAGTRKPLGECGVHVVLHPEDEGLLDLDTPWLPPGMFEDEDTIGIFKAYYVGSCPVRELSGAHVCAEAVKRVRQMRLPPRDVSIVISAGSVSLIERYEGTYLQHSAIGDITYSVLDRRDNRNFSFITLDGRAGFAYCHVLKIYADGPNLPPALSKARQLAGLSDNMDDVSRALNKDDKGAGRGAAGGGKGGASLAAKSLLGMFESTYLGSMSVDVERDNSTIFEAMWRIRGKFLKAAYLQDGDDEDADDWTELGGEHVSLMISEDGLRIVEFQTGETLDFSFIQSITFFTSVSSTLDESDPQHDVFAYITKNEQLGLMVAHVFKCAPRQARKICKTLGMAFKMLNEEDGVGGAGSKKKNPFKSTAPNKDVDVTSLFGEQIDRSQLEMVKALGSGQFGMVYLAEHTFKDKRGKGLICVERAVKVLREDTNERDQEDFLREALIMTQLNHGNLVRLIGVSVDYYPWLLVLEFVKYGDLRSVVQACEEYGLELTSKEQLGWARQLASGMGYLASKNYVHMDLAARNCLLHTNSIIKVSDFGLTKQYDAGKNYYRVKPNTTLKLPVKWMAPECFEGLRFSESSDVWAYGVTMWEILSYGEIPFRDVANANVRKAIKDGMRLDKPARCPDTIFGLLKQCWTLNKDERWKFAALHEHCGLLMADDSSAVRDIGAELAALKKAGKAKRKMSWRKLGKKKQAAPGDESYLDMDGDDAAAAGGAQDSYLTFDQDGPGGSGAGGGDDAYLDIQLVKRRSNGSQMYIEVEEVFRKKSTGLDLVNAGGAERHNPLFVDIEEGDESYMDLAQDGQGLEEYFDVHAGGAEGGDSYFEMGQPEAQGGGGDSYFEMGQ